MISRRNLIASAGLIPAGALLTRCGQTPTPATPVTPATVSQQLINDVNAGLTTGLTTAALLGAMTPPVLTAAQVSAIDAVLQKAQGVMGDVTALTPAVTGVTTMQTVDGYINTALTTLASVPVIPAPFNLAVAGMALVAPEIEAFVASILGTVSATAPSPVRAKLANPKVPDINAARSYIGSAVVK